MTTATGVNLPVFGASGRGVQEDPRQNTVDRLTNETDTSNAQTRRQFSKKRIRTLTVDLSIARNDEEQFYSGTLVAAPFASSNTAQLDVRIDDILNDPITFLGGYSISGVPYDRIFLSNEAQDGESMQLMFIVDEPGDRVTIEA